MDRIDWNITTTCSAESTQEPLTLEKLKEIYEELEKNRPEFDEVAMSKDTLDFLCEHGLNHDQYSNIRISDFVPYSFVIGFEKGRVKKIMKVAFEPKGEL